MREEGFTEEEIERKINAIKDKNNNLMSKVILRFQLPREERPMLKCFDHWVLWLKMRKLMRH